MMKVEIDNVESGLADDELGIMLNLAFRGMDGGGVMGVLWREAQDADREQIVEWIKLNLGEELSGVSEERNDG